MKVSFKFFLVSMFVFLSFSITAIIVGVSISFNKQNINKIVEFNFEKVANNFIKKSSDNDKLYINTVDALVTFLEDKSLNDIFKNKESVMNIIIGFLEGYRDLNSVFIISEAKQNFIVHKLSKKEAYNEIGKDAYYLVRLIDNQSDTKYYYDKSLKNLIAKKQVVFYTDYSHSSWYEKAMKNPKKTFKTDIHTFEYFNKRGVKYVNNYKKGHIIGANLLMQDLKDILLKEKDSNVVKNAYFSGDELVLSEDPKDNTLIRDMFEEYKLNQNKNTIQDNKNLYRYNIKQFNNEYFLSYANISLMMKPFNDQLLNILMISIIVMFILMIIVYIFASHIIKPIELLVVDVKKIAKNQFDKIKPIDCFISEFNELYVGIKTSANSLQEYQEKLEELSSMDSLTNIYNRRSVERILDEKIEDFKRYNLQFGVIMVDIDHFKMVNDTYGHQIGDEVLIDFVKILKSNIRDNDIIGRWGGEEFIIVCKQINEQDLEFLAERLRKAVSEHKFNACKHKTGSFGITCIKKDDTKSSILTRVDQVLYEAKNSGRNKVCKA